MGLARTNRNVTLLARLLFVPPPSPPFTPFTSLSYPPDSSASIAPALHTRVHYRRFYMAPIYIHDTYVSRVHAWTPGEKGNSSRVCVCLPRHSTPESDRPEWNEIPLWLNTGKVPTISFLFFSFPLFHLFFSQPTAAQRSLQPPNSDSPKARKPACMENICPS